MFIARTKKAPKSRGAFLYKIIIIAATQQWCSANLKRVQSFQILKRVLIHKLFLVSRQQEYVPFED